MQTSVRKDPKVPRYPAGAAKFPSGKIVPGYWKGNLDTELTIIGIDGDIPIIKINKGAWALLRNLPEPSKLMNFQLY